MSIIKFLLLASYSLTQVTVLAAPIPFTAPLKDDALFSRATGNKRLPPLHSRQVYLEYVTWNLQWHQVPQVSLQSLNGSVMLQVKHVFNYLTVDN